MRALTYGDLPDPLMGGLRVDIICADACDGYGPYSGSRGDYWYRGDDEPVTCGACGGPMVMVQERRRFVTIDPDTMKVAASEVPS